MIIPHIQSKMLVSQHLICCSFSNFFAHENFNNLFLLGTLHKNRISIKSVTPGLQNGKNLKNQTLNKVLISNFTHGFLYNWIGKLFCPPHDWATL